MASRRFFDPVTLLRLAPVVSATGTLQLAWDQQWLLSVFTRPQLEHHTNQYLPKWFKECFASGLPKVLGLLTVTVATSVINLRVRRSLLQERGASVWYAAGATLAVGHLAFVPAVAPKVQAIIEDQPQGEAAGEMRKWLRVNLVRTLTVDTGAWICLIIAVSRTLA